MPMLGPMLLDDPAVPAAVHLTGGEACALLSVAVETFGGTLHAARPCDVQYRPGREAVVRYDARVTWGRGPTSRETLIASATTHGPPAGTVPITAVGPAGEAITAGVWRWPFDPVLVGLGTAVTPESAVSLLPDDVAGPVRLTVRSYRPTERAVVSAVDADGVERYLKVLPPGRVAGVVERHRLLAAAGLPVPAVTALDAELGVIALEAFTGMTLREELSIDTAIWPDADAFQQLFDGFANTDLGHATPRRCRTAAAAGHARLLRAAAPELTPMIDDLVGPMQAAARRSAGRAGPTVHGDLYDAQLFTSGRRIVGVIDLDDAGPGDPIDDRATVLGYLLVKAMHAGPQRRSLERYAATLRRGFCTVGGIDQHELDIATASVMLGLATGPFRSQTTSWRRETRRHLDRATEVLGPNGELAARRG